MPDIPTDADAAQAMRQFGGDFIKSLAECWLRADSIRKARLKNAFSPEFEQYRQVAHMRKIDEQVHTEAMLKAREA